MERSLSPEQIVLRGKVLKTVESMIEAAPNWEQPESQARYFEGLVGGYYQCGLLSDLEMKMLRERMRENLPAQPAWWDLATKLGI